MANAQEEARSVDHLQTEARGFYVLWGEHARDADQLLALPFVRGGQVVVQWGEIEPASGQYDFTKLDAQLQAIATHKVWTTVQVNGNVKPAWLFDTVPSVPQKIDIQVRDPRGTLLFWAPSFQKAHLAMIAAVADHLRASPYRDRLLGVRLNFNAVGTEKTGVPAELRAPEHWTAPPGAPHEGIPPYTNAVRDAYEAQVIEAYRKGFADWLTVFVRNNIEDAVAQGFKADFQAGRLGLFHTSSEAEPRSSHTENQYGKFYDFCRTGRTVGYAEPWASAWGEHGGKDDARWCSPAQWIYWTLLLNLDCGVSFIGEYYTNLHYAFTGEHGAEHAGVDGTGPREFRAAYAWGADYVGRHNRPAESPGAWVAFRENHVVKADNGDAAPERRLARFTGDYDWLMQRLPDGSQGVGPVGPAEQRFGAFARLYAPGQSARLQLDPAFRQTLEGTAFLRVTYFDAPGDGPAGSVSLAADSGTERLGDLPAQGSGRWQTADFPLSATALREAPDAWQVQVTAGDRPLTLHMVELRRAAPADAPLPQIHP